MKTKQRINKKRAAYAHEKRQIAATQPQQSLSDPFPLSSPVKSESATTKMQGATILKSPANDSPRSYSSEVWVGAGFQTGSEVSPSTDIQSFGNTAPSSPSSAVGLKWSASPIYSAELRYDYVPSAINTEVLGSSVNSKLVGQALTADVTSRFLQSGKSRMRGVLRMQNREQQILVLSEDARLFGYKKKTQMLGIGAAYDHAYSSRLMFQGSLVFQTPFSQQTEGPKSGVDLQTPFFVEGAAGIKYNTSSRINYGLFVLGQASRTDYSQSINKQSSGAEQSLHFGGMFMIGYGLGQGNDSK